MATETAETTRRPQRLVSYTADVGERTLVGQLADGVVRISESRRSEVGGQEALGRGTDRLPPVERRPGGGDRGG